MDEEPGMSEASREDLDGVRRGDPDAWRAFVARYEDVVAATVIGMIGRGPEAEDIGQEVFIRFFKNVHSFRGDASVSTYLTRSAINLSLNAIKRRQRMRRWFAGPPVDVHESTDLDPARQAEQHDLSETVARSIRRLKPDFRAVVVLRLVQGLSTSATAEALGVPEGTVMSRLSRAQGQLRKQLQGVLTND
jgi:RNA polymerase sigma-70 factor (ECF subfamily)